MRERDIFQIKTHRKKKFFSKKKFLLKKGFCFELNESFQKALQRKKRYKKGITTYFPEIFVVHSSKKKNFFLSPFFMIVMLITKKKRIFFQRHLTVIFAFLSAIFRISREGRRLNEVLNPESWKILLFSLVELFSRSAGRNFFLFFSSFSSRRRNIWKICRRKLFFGGEHHNREIPVN